MRNLIYLIFLIVLISCKESIHDLNNDIKNPNIYIEVKNPDNTKDTIEFFIVMDKPLMDSLKISKAELVNICCNAATYYGDYNVKFKQTYKYNKSGYISYDYPKDSETNGISVEVQGTCANGYGVKDDIRNVIHFDLKGRIKKDEDGNPKILTY